VDRERRVLIVDDEENMRLVLRTCLEREGYQVAEAPDGHKGLVCLETGIVDFVLCDVRMPHMDGLTFLREVVARGFTAPVIMLSAYGTVDAALDAIRAGAFDYVFKPFNPDEILLTLKKAEDQVRLRRENLALRRAAAKTRPAGVVARSKAMADLLVLVGKVAEASSPVLICGESGTGKELIARAVHEGGSRNKNRFVPVNCGAIPENLMESELFGHVKGAFTGAVHDHAGLFAAAEGGTLFLDEIGELTLPLQVKLLRVLQDREVRPVGSTTAVKINARIVAATARDLAQEVRNGNFREDLYYRLNVLPLFIPPLRERPEDISPLLEHFLTLFAAREDRDRPDVSTEVLAALRAYPWPGNVRELENIVERMLVLSPSDRLEFGDIPSHILFGVGGEEPLTSGEEGDLDLKSRVRELEARLIKEALDRSNGNRSLASRRLKISYPSLLAKIKAYELD